MGAFFDWVTRLGRAHAFPEGSTTPVRVDVVARIVSPNVVRSPITNLDGAVIDVTLVDRETVVGERYAEEREQLTPLGFTRYGTELVVVDGAGRALVIEAVHAFRVVPLSLTPSVLDVAVPGELASVAQRSQHMLTYREVRFRESDRVRVVATVRTGVVASSAGYRGGARSVLVPVSGERFDLYEML